MEISLNTPPLIFVLGPTASGKSQWALELAEKFNGVIFNCDSVQVYDGLVIGSARPSPEDCGRVPHYLYGIVIPPQTMTAGEYRRIFFETLAKNEIKAPIFVVGGTGFYFQALEKGMYPVAKVSEDLHNAVLKEIQVPGGPEKLFAELEACDPESALRISRRDHYRLGRAIELIRSEGLPLSKIREKFSTRIESETSKAPLEVFKVGMRIEKKELEIRIQKRTEEMLRRGLRGEVQKLIDQGLESWQPLRSVGYAETIEALRNHHDDQWLKEKIVLGTRQLAKKQKTWFQRDSEIHWAEDRHQQIEIEKKIAEFLQTKNSTRMET